MQIVRQGNFGILQKVRIMWKRNFPSSSKNRIQIYQGATKAFVFEQMTSIKVIMNMQKGK